jgi:hypothetical protein
VEWLKDSRLRFSIRHDVLRGVTPAMLVWWLQHLEGEMDVEGARQNRYRVLGWKRHA